VDKAPLLTGLIEKAHWEIAERPDGGWALTLMVVTPGEAGDERPLEREGRREGREALDRSVAILRDFVRPVVDQARPYRSVAPWLMNRQSVDDLCAELRRDGEPLYLPSQTNNTLPKVQSLYVRGNRGDHDNVVDWLRRIEQQLREALSDVQMPLSAERWNSTDPYRFTVVRTDEMIASEGFDARRSLRDKYLAAIRVRQTGGVAINPEDALREARLLHTFPADVNAIDYELRIARHFRRTYQPLDARIVALLEAPSRMRLYLVARASGLLEQFMDDTTDPPQRAWVLNLHESGAPVTRERLTDRHNDNTLVLTPFRGIRQHEEYTQRELEDRAHRFVVGGRDARQDRNIALNPQRISRVIQERFGAQGILRKRLSAAIHEGFVRDWRESEEYRGTYLELMGYLAELLLQEYADERDLGKL
jgi:hypothetical protein